MVQNTEIEKKLAENTPNGIGLSSLLMLHDEASTVFEPIWRMCDANEKYRIVDNWDAETRAKIEAQDRIPYSMPIAQTKLMPISGYQKTMRTDWKVQESADPRDEVKAALAELVLRDVARQSNFQEIESEMFDDALYIKFGAVENYLDTECVPQMPKVRLVDYRDIIWDSNATKYDLEDALFMAKITRFYRYQLEEKYGPLVSQSMTGEGFMFNGREKNSYYVGTRNPANNQQAFDLISVFEHYQKVQRKYHCVLFPDSMGMYGENMIYEEFRSKKEADQRLRELNMNYMMAGLDPEGSTEIREKTKLDRYLFTYNQVLEYEETELDMYPFTCFFAIFIKGKFISMMDFLKSPQIFYDRMISQTDYSLGKSLKNVYQMNPSLLADGETTSSALKKASNGGVVLSNTMENDIIRQIGTTNVPPQYFQLFQFLTAIIDDSAGGRSFAGLSEGSNESGKSIIAKQRMGEVVAGNFLDNLSKTKRLIGKKTLWWVRNYDTAERIIQVQGGELSQRMIQLLTKQGLFQQSKDKPYKGYVRVNVPDERLSWLKDANFELTISEEEYSEANKDKKLAQNLEAAKLMPEITQTPKWRESMLASLGYSFDDRQQILGELGMMQQQQQIEQAMLEGAKAGGQEFMTQQV